MRPLRLVFVLWAILSIAFGGDPPPSSGYNFGINREPTKVDAAFGNLGELGPVYNVTDKRNESTVNSMENPRGSTDEPIKLTAKPLKTVNTTTLAPPEKFDNSHTGSVEYTTTRKTTDREGTTLITENVDGGEKEPLESTTVSSPVQTFETTTVSEEQATQIPALGGNHNISNSSINLTAQATTPQYLSNPITSTSPLSNTSTPMSSSSEPITATWSFSKPTITPPTQGSALQTTSDEQPSLTFHTGTPTTTETQTVISTNPGHNVNKPNENSSLASKPNSSPSLYPHNGNFWLTSAVISFYAISKL